MQGFYTEKATGGSFKSKYPKKFPQHCTWSSYKQGNLRTANNFLCKDFSINQAPSSRPPPVNSKSGSLGLTATPLGL